MGASTCSHQVGTLGHLQGGSRHPKTQCLREAEGEEEVEVEVGEAAEGEEEEGEEEPDQDFK